MGVPLRWADMAPQQQEAAIADGIEALCHGVLKKGMVHVATGGLLFQNLESFSYIDSPCFAGVVIEYKAGERLADHEAHIEWQARVVAHRSAGTVQSDDGLIDGQYQIAGAFKWDDLFGYHGSNRLVDLHQFAGRCRRHDLAVIAVGPYLGL